MATTLDTLQTPQDQSYNKVIRTYEFLHKLFFGLGMSIVSLIISIVVAVMIINSDTMYQTRQSSDAKSEQIVLSGRQNSIRTYDKHPFVKLFVKQGPLSVTESSVQTLDNLLTYKGFVVPRGIDIDTTVPLQSISYFSTTGYAEIEIENYMKIIVLTPSKAFSIADESPALLSPGQSLLSYFGVACLKEPKITTVFCDAAIQDMLDVLPAYNIGKDYTGLQLISQNLIATPFQQQFCDNVRQYMFFLNDTSYIIENILHSCGKDHDQSYNDFAGFRTIQTQLDKQFINSIVTPSSLLNAYKLVSIQQTIYNELSIGKFNELRIKSYAKYLEELLRRSDSIQSFYFDSIALYNNRYLIPELNKLFLKSRSQDKTIKELLENLRLINEGNTLVGYDGLIRFVTNPNFVDISNMTIIPSNMAIKSLDTIFRETNSFSKFSVSSVTPLSGNFIQVQGVFYFDGDKAITNKLKSTLMMKYNGQRFMISEFLFPEYALLTQNMNTLFSHQQLTLPALYDELLQNAVYLNTSTKSVCDILRDSQYIVSCTTKTIVIKSVVLTGNVKYTINYEAGSLLSYLVSNTTIQTKAQQELGTPTTTDSTLAFFVNKLANYMPSASSNPSVNTTVSVTGTAQLLQVREDFATIGAQVGDIKPVGSLYSVQFTLQGISFLAAYDLSIQTILGVAIVTDTKTTIRGFVLNLSNPKAQDVVSFGTDPKVFIAQKDPLLVKRLLK